MPITEQLQRERKMFSANTGFRVADIYYVLTLKNAAIILSDSILKLMQRNIDDL